MTRKRSLAHLALVWASVLTLPLGAQAVDGVIEINQTRALAGGAEDTPGFPVQITQPGSYRLTSDLAATDTGITISADDVTLDLNGFTIRCESCPPTSRGIAAESQSGTSVLNGTVRGFYIAGVNLGTNARIDRVRAVGGFGNGFQLGSDCKVSDATAANNAAVGFSLGSGCTISNSTAVANLAGGILGTTSVSVTGCSTSGNTGAGISVAGGSTISGSTADSNIGVGFAVLGATIQHSGARNNTLQGISANASSVIGNAVYANLLDGIFATGGALVVDNTSTDNLGDGIETENAALLQNNMISTNQGYGIRITVTFMTPGAVYTGNTVWGNQAGGFDGSGVDEGSNVCLKGTAPAC